MTFEGRAAIVTGAASPIGAAIAQRLASQGASLALGDVDADGLAKAVANLQETGTDRLVALPGDLAAAEGAAALIAACRSAFGRLDILVNNAGGGVLLPTLAHTEDTLRATIDRNLWTTIYSTLAALPLMVDQGYGRIVNLGAESVRSGIALHAVYNAAKGGVHGFTTGLAREFAGHGITVNTVAPAMVWTDAVAAIDAPELVAIRDGILAMIPAGRAATVDEVASMVAYLASDDAGFVTGQVISVNGGSSML